MSGELIDFHSFKRERWEEAAGALHPRLWNRAVQIFGKSFLSYVWNDFKKTVPTLKYDERLEPLLLVWAYFNWLPLELDRPIAASLLDEELSKSEELYLRAHLEGCFSFYLVLDVDLEKGIIVEDLLTDVIHEVPDLKAAASMLPDDLLFGKIISLPSLKLITTICPWPIDESFEQEIFDLQNFIIHRHGQVTDALLRQFNPGIMELFVECLLNEPVPQTISAPETLPLSSTPWTGQIEFILRFLNENSVKATQLGNFPKNLILAFNQAFPDKYGFKVRVEKDVLSLTMLRHFLQSKKLVRKYKSHFLLTKLGSTVLAENKLDLIYKDLFDFAIREWNLGYDDRYPAYPQIQHSGIEFLKYVSFEEEKWLDETDVEKLFFLNFSDSGISDRKHFLKCLCLRIIERFAHPLGLVELSCTDSIFERQKFRKTELLSKLFT